METVITRPYWTLLTYSFLRQKPSVSWKKTDFLDFCFEIFFKKRQNRDSLKKAAFEARWKTKAESFYLYNWESGKITFWSYKKIIVFRLQRSLRAPSQILSYIYGVMLRSCRHGIFPIWRFKWYLTILYIKSLLKRWGPLRFIQHVWFRLHFKGCSKFKSKEMSYIITVNFCGTAHSQFCMFNWNQDENRR